jgi:hypothetical protein
LILPSLWHRPLFLFSIERNIYLDTCTQLWQGEPFGFIVFLILYRLILEFRAEPQNVGIDELAELRSLLRLDWIVAACKDKTEVAVALWQGNQLVMEFGGDLDACDKGDCDKKK